MPETLIHGVLFDKDGTLFDFHATWKKVIDAVIDNLAPDRETWTRMAEIAGYDHANGRFLPGSPVVAETTEAIAEIWAAFRPDLGARHIERILDTESLITLADPAALSPAVPDLTGVLAGLRASGYRLGVATHDSEQGARVQLGAAGAAAQFDFIAGYDSGYGLKPGPGMPMAFAEATGIDPGNIAMVGDSRHDLEAGRSAGTAVTVGVLTGPASRNDLAPHADYILATIDELPALLEQFRG